MILYLDRRLSLKSILSKSVIFFLIICCSPFLTAALLDDSFDLKSLNEKKIGYYIGSFDPIHLGHQHVIDSAIQSGYVDYVLIYPNPGGDNFKNRSEHAFRQEMITSIYLDNPKVLVTFWSPKELQDRFSKAAGETEIIGIIGSDVVTEKLMGPDATLRAKYQKVFMRGIPLEETHFNDTVGAIMALKANAFVVALRNGIDLSYLGNKLDDRQIIGFISSTGHSSTEVRNLIMNKQRFEHLVSFPVQAFIKQKAMYGFSSRFNTALQQELLDMEKADQEIRRSVMTTDPSQRDWDSVSEVDIKHGKRLKEIVKLYGWLGVSDVGLNGTSALWLLIQHQDHDVDFQKECLFLLDKAVQAYESPMQHYAYLLDRVNMNQKIPQVYGTQWIQENDMYTLYNVEDPENLDKRRQEAGLCTIAEYKESLKQVYQLTDGW